MFEKLAEIVAPFTGEAYYVGGCVRDCLLGRPIKDVDIAVAADPRAVGEAVRRALGGHFFWLRERDGTARVLPGGAESLQIDIVPLAGAIVDDLRRRDYTVNAMAIPVAAGLSADAPVLDPTGGLTDLKAQRLRLAADSALEADPLRTLRGVRLAVQLGFSLEPATAVQIRQAGPWLDRVSRERIRDELFACLAVADRAAALSLLREFGLLGHAIPELAPLLDGDLWEATVAHVGAVERFTETLPFAPEMGDAIRWHLARALTPPRERPTLLELGALLWRLPRDGAGTEAAERPGKGAPLRKVGGAASRVGQQLALSGVEAAWLARLLAHRETAVAWVREPPPVDRAVYRFWRQAGDAALDALLVAMVSPEHGDAGPGLADVVQRLLEYERGEHPPLLSGQDVMAISGLRPGPALGGLLESLAEAQADGAVRTPEEARLWIAAWRDGPADRDDSIGGPNDDCGSGGAVPD